MSTSVLGQPISMPICVAPTASHEMAHPEAEIATARGMFLCIMVKTNKLAKIILSCLLQLYNFIAPPGAQAAQTLMGLSCFASKKIAVVADGAPGGLLWMQMNIFCDRQVNLKIARAAEQNGFKALMVTVDTGVVGHKYSDFRDKDQLYGHLTYPNLNFATMKDGSADYLPAMAAMDFRAGWDFIDWLKKETKLPIVVKGILTAEDAVLAIEHGVQGIVVSNHGGRQLDTVPATVRIDCVMLSCMDVLRHIQHSLLFLADILSIVIPDWLVVSFSWVLLIVCVVFFFTELDQITEAPLHLFHWTQLTFSDEQSTLQINIVRIMTLIFYPFHSVYS